MEKRKADLRAWAATAGVAEKRTDLRRSLIRGTFTAGELADNLNITERQVLSLIKLEIESGAAIHKSGKHYTIELGQVPAKEPHFGHSWTGESYRFGLISDTHFGSKYAREDVCASLYDWFAEEGITRVYHAGNWIDGEARFNRFDLLPGCHGMQNQIDYFVQRYPKRKGIKTFLVSGDDHEGWYVQREGVNIGAMMQETAERHGRDDLIDLGYMECFITLKHKDTGKTARMLICHPGGGSAYATSYAPQKIIESYQPGEKPAVAIFGHYHKIEYLNIRGVHAIQAGCTKDTDPFARKKRLSYHVGGAIVELRQDRKGAVQDCIPWFRQFYDRGYHNDQFAMSHVPTRRKSR